MSIFFITGTDTDCGKTYSTCRTLEHLSFLKQSCVALKPIASGCSIENKKLINADVEALQKGNKQNLKINNWLFESPVSPHLASKHLCAEKIAEFCLNSTFQTFEHQLIEGAGGIMVPLNEEETWIDFLNYIPSIQVILVVGMKLGCLNHALLTEALLFEKQIKCAGWIANCMDPDMLMLKENIDTLKYKMKPPHLATVPYSGQLIPEPAFQTLFT